MLVMESGANDHSIKLRIKSCSNRAIRAEATYNLIDKTSVVLKLDWIRIVCISYYIVCINRLYYSVRIHGKFTMIGVLLCMLVIKSNASRQVC